MDLNKPYRLIGATRYFGSKVVLLFEKPNNEMGILYLNKKYSDVFTQEDVKDIYKNRGKYCIMYRIHPECDICFYFDIIIKKQSDM
jgi:hypothetical protein